MTVSPKTWGNLRAGTHLTMRRQVLEAWRCDCWKRDYRLCSWGAVGVMPDLILSKIASSIKIKTVDNLLEAISDWVYARKYGHEVLLLLKDADREHQVESQARRVKTRTLNRKRKIGDLEMDGARRDLAGFTPSGPSTTPLTSALTRMIDPIIVKHVGHPTRPQPSRPRPRPRPILVSRP